MARYTGPATRKSRRLGIDLVGGDQSFEKRPYPPGQHGRARIKESEYRQQLQEKQKARFTYGLTERQFRNLFAEASRRQGVTGENMLRFLELRLVESVRLGKIEELEDVGILHGVERRRDLLPLRGERE